MATINPTYRDRKRFTLQHKYNGTLVLSTEPIGWQTDEKEYARNKNYHGIFTKFSNSLKFIDEAADFIDLGYELYGINYDIRLVCDVKNDTTDVWERAYDGFLDLSTYQKEKNQVSVKFNSSGLEKLLKARESEKLELERETSIDGKELDPLQTETVHYDGRRIFLETIFDVTNADNTASMSTQTNGNTRGETVGVPLHIVNKSHEEAHSVIPNTIIGDNNHSIQANGITANMFFTVSHRERSLHIKFDLDFDCRITYDDINFYNFTVYLTKYKNGVNYNLKENILLRHWNENTHGNGSTKSYSIQYDDTINLLEGESLALQFHHSMDGENNHSAHFNSRCFNIVCPMTIEEDSYTEPTNSKFILAHEAGDRIVQIISGRKDAFYSELLGRTDIDYDKDGFAGLNGITHGHWVRGYDSEDNLFKKLTTSFKDFKDSLSAVHCIGVGVEKIGFKERVRLEELGFFFNKNVTTKLGKVVDGKFEYIQVKNVKRTVAKDYYYSGVDIGYEKGGEYEEAMGLDEPNARTSFTTTITRLKKIYQKVSKYRTDSYGLEFARRKQINLNPTEDTRYDKDIFLLDLKRGLSSIFLQRKWQDDFEQEPTGIFSPETAINLRFSPVNMILRHGWVLSAGLTKYLSDYLRYGSSVANSQLRTKLIGGIERAENENIINSELKRAKYVPEWVEFEYQVDSDFARKIEDSTEVLGKKIPNYYGQFEYLNENNELEKGFLFSLKPNGKGKWKILKGIN